jgi:hypothetical protein
VDKNLSFAAWRSKMEEIIRYKMLRSRRKTIMVYVER